MKAPAGGHARQPQEHISEPRFQNSDPQEHESELHEHESEPQPRSSDASGLIRGAQSNVSEPREQKSELRCDEREPIRALASRESVEPGDRARPESSARTRPPTRRYPASPSSGGQQNNRSSVVADSIIITTRLDHAVVIATDGPASSCSNAGIRGGDGCRVVAAALARARAEGRELLAAFDARIHSSHRHTVLLQAEDTAQRDRGLRRRRPRGAAISDPLGCALARPFSPAYTKRGRYT
jgi:hypothetical protein